MLAALRVALEPQPRPAIDASMLPLCMKVIAGDSSAARELEAHPVVRKMSEGMREEVQFTAEELARAAFLAADDQRFSWRRLRDNARFVTPFAAKAPTLLEGLIGRNAARASEFLATPMRADNVPVHLVCGGPWDGYVLYFDRGAELFLDIGWHADGEIDAILPGFEAVLTHELWHIAFGEHVRMRFAVDYKHAVDPATLFIYEMINEGVGHYYSMRPRLYPTISVAQFEEKQAAVFALLETSYPQLLAEKDADRRREMLWRSHAGVPFWQKWGAVPGALVVYRLVEAIGAEGVRALLAHEPFSLLIAYQDQRAAHPAWPPLPMSLVEDARRLRRRQVPGGGTASPQ
ncbi:MAG: hypothetical protein HY903_05060 [Deltaproteobacteria bacterium]|nr:hypothetical protein [Deltaproteobacteria bacterium]